MEDPQNEGEDQSNWPTVLEIAIFILVMTLTMILIWHFVPHAEITHPMQW